MLRRELVGINFLNSDSYLTPRLESHESLEFSDSSQVKVFFEKLKTQTQMTDVKRDGLSERAVLKDKEFR